MSFRPSICSKEQGTAEWKVHQKHTFPYLKRSGLLFLIVVVANNVFKSPEVAMWFALFGVAYSFYFMISVLKISRITRLAKGSLEGNM